MSIGRRIAVAGLSALLAGCYTLQPAIGGAPDAGSSIALEVNDAGRVALGGSMGPEIGQIEGKLIQKDSENYIIAVSAIRLLRGGEQAWSGERVTLKSEYVSRAYERRFSKGRTIALGAVTVGGFVAFLVTRDLLGSGSEGPPGNPGDSVNTRIVRP